MWHKNKVPSHTHWTIINVSIKKCWSTSPGSYTSLHQAQLASRLFYTGQHNACNKGNDTTITQRKERPYKRQKNKTKQQQRNSKSNVAFLNENGKFFKERQTLLKIKTKRNSKQRPKERDGEKVNSWISGFISQKHSLTSVWMECLAKFSAILFSTQVNFFNCCWIIFTGLLTVLLEAPVKQLRLLCYTHTHADGQY